MADLSCPSCGALNDRTSVQCRVCSHELSPNPAEQGTLFVARSEPSAVRSGEAASLLVADGKCVELRTGDVVGRNAVGREILERYDEISRRHAQFTRQEGRWYLMDLGSSNGTFLDGERIPARSMVAIRDGQVVRLSPVFEAKFSSPGEVRAPDDRKTMVILFADLKGSVDAFQEKGTMLAMNWIVNLYRMLSGIVAANGGTHVKNIGDAILAVFEDPVRSAAAALQMQADLREHNKKTEEADHYYMRIGMNIGSVLFEDNDVFGNAVNIAARVQAIAPPEKIYISRQLYEAVQGSPGLGFRFVGNERLKGVREETGIYELLPGE